VLVPEVQARRALRERPIHLRVLAPCGSWIGCGTLRVLRLKANDAVVPAPFCRAADEPACDDSELELTVGYESYYQP
jgi:hypothetical protein